MSPDMTRSKHTTHMAVDKGTGFVHYRPGCLCHECPNYIGCRLATKPIMIKDVIPGDKPDVNPVDIKTMSPGMKKVLEAIKSHPEGLTVRAISIATGVTARHVYRCVKKLRAAGLIKKLWELRHERILDTRLRFYETAEVAHRYVISSDKKILQEVLKGN